LEWLNNNKDYDVLNYLLSVKNHWYRTFNLNVYIDVCY
jgi:hypothetical protein